MESWIKFRDKSYTIDSRGFIKTYPAIYISSLGNIKGTSIHYDENNKKYFKDYSNRRYILENQVKKLFKGE